MHFVFVRVKVDKEVVTVLLPLLRGCCRRVCDGRGLDLAPTLELLRVHYVHRPCIHTSRTTLLCSIKRIDKV